LPGRSNERVDCGGRDELKFRIGNWKCFTTAQSADLVILEGSDLQAEGFTNILTRSRVELDLQDGVAVRAFYAAERPAVVGGSGGIV